ncbi:NAD(P)-dependent dehydrogenase (short-subunit alcohol dehydrogenase family) [Bradyrhizobium sp. LM3.2]
MPPSCVPFAAQRARVAFFDLDASAGEALVAEVAAASGTAPLFVPCDLLDIDALRGAMAQVHGSLGDAAVLVNNAANDQRQVLAEVTPAEFDWTIGVNLKHVFFAAQAVVPQMQARGGGSIINMSSIAWMRGAPALPVYAAAKAAIVGFTNSLARLVGPDRIRVNAIAPGMVITGASAPAVVSGRTDHRRAANASGHSRRGDTRGYREHGAVPRLRREPAHHAPVFSGRRRDWLAAPGELFVAAPATLHTILLGSKLLIENAINHV